MDIRRKLVYEDKSSLKDYGVRKADSLNYLVYYGWLKKRSEIDPFDPKAMAYYLRAFNDAYYICTLALMLPKEMELKESVINLYVERPSIVFPMVHLFLSKLSGGTFGIRVLLDDIETKCKRDNDWERNLIQLQESLAGYKDSIEPATFAQRVLTKEFLSTIKWEEFAELTNKFDKNRIELVVRNYARTRDHWNLLCEAIKEAAISYDYDFGFEEKEREGWDEDGPYVETAKVARSPYDSEGNEILEPLKRSGVYEFCDELKGRYDELALVSQTMFQEASAQADSDNKKSGFKFCNDFVKERVRMAMSVCNNHKSDLALLEVTLFAHNLLYESNKHKSFLRGLVDWGLLPELSGDENSEEFRMTLHCIRDKARKLRKLSNDKYMSWDSKSKDRAKCVEMGKKLGETMKYQN